MKTGPMNLFAGQQWRHTYREQTCARGGRKVKVGSVQRMTWKHTLSCVKQISSGHLPCDSGDAKQGSVTTNTGKATQRHQLLETCESKLPWGYHLTLLRKAIIKKKKKKSTNKKRWRGCGDKGTLLPCVWDVQLKQPPRKYYRGSSKIK